MKTVYVFFVCVFAVLSGCKSTEPEILISSPHILPELDEAWSTGTVNGVPLEEGTEDFETVVEQFNMFEAGLDELELVTEKIAPTDECVWSDGPVSVGAIIGWFQFEKDTLSWNNPIDESFGTSFTILSGEIYPVITHEDPFYGWEKAGRIRIEYSNNVFVWPEYVGHWCQPVIP